MPYSGVTTYEFFSNRGCAAVLHLAASGT